MSAVDRILSSIRRVIVMETRLQSLSEGMAEVTRTVMDHEKRLVRLETIEEVAGARRLPPTAGS
ncbi:MAG: hypothetical protein ACR2RB_14730 [Gammaproteobacteria bacterium]